MQTTTEELVVLSRPDGPMYRARIKPCDGSIRGLTGQPWGPIVQFHNDHGMVAEFYVNNLIEHHGPDGQSRGTGIYLVFPDSRLDATAMAHIMRWLAGESV